MEPLDERVVAQIWYGQHLHRDRLVTTDRQPVQVIWRGRPNGGDAGPDFRDAIIVFGDGTLQQGDVELHVKASDWWAHGHDRDSRYNNVILHVVLRADTARPLARADGGSAPTLELGKHLEKPLPELLAVLKHDPPVTACNEPCRRSVAHLTERGGTAAILASIGELLDENGTARFKQKVAAFESELAARPIDAAPQIAYEALADALGYSRNRIPFRRLARRVPLTYILPLAQRKRLDAEAVLLGTGGLLPGNDTALAAGLEEFRLRADMADAWSILSRKVAPYALDPQPLIRAEWQWGGTRPDNFPTRRTVALAYLLAYRSSAPQTLGWHLLDELLDRIRSGAHTKEAFAALHAPLTVAGEGYWTEHCDWGGKRLGKQSDLLGAARAADITVNIILPFAAAYGDLTEDAALLEGAQVIYSHHPKLADNAVAKEMLEQILGAAEPQVRAAAPKLANSARRQQGLLHIHALWCKLHVCAECAFSQGKMAR